jgi:hypothetical protein
MIIVPQAVSFIVYAFTCRLAIGQAVASRFKSPSSEPEDL